MAEKAKKKKGKFHLPHLNLGHKESKGKKAEKKAEEKKDREEAKEKKADKEKVKEKAEKESKKEKAKPEKALKIKAKNEGVVKLLKGNKSYVNKIVALVSEIQALDSQVDNFKEEVEKLKVKFDKGEVSKFAYLQSMDRSKMKLDSLMQTKKELLKMLVDDMTELKDGLEKVKEIYAVRAENELLGELK